MINFSSQNIVHTIVVSLVVIAVGFIAWLRSSLKKAQGEVRNVEIQAKVDQVEIDNSKKLTRDLVNDFDNELNKDRKG